MRTRLIRAAVAVVAAASCGLVTAGCASTTASRDDAVAVVRERPVEADVCFVAMMVPHHQQAVEMSDILLSKDGVWERGRRFARYVLAAQRQEIEAMEAWLAAWDSALADAAGHLAAAGSGPRVPADLAPGGDPAGGGGHGPHAGPDVVAERDVAALPSCDHAHGATMDGMLGDEEMDALRQAAAGDAQRLYLELMVPHHEGALAMAVQALAAAENEFVRSSAAHVVQEQTSELASIRAMLASIDAGDLGLPDDYVPGPYRTYDVGGGPPVPDVADGGDLP